MLISQPKLVLQRFRVRLVGTQGLVLRDQRPIDRDEIGAHECRADRQIQFCAAPEVRVERTNLDETLAASHQRARAQLSPNKVRVSIQGEEEIGDGTAIRLRRPTANSKADMTGLARAIGNHVPVRVAEY